MSATQWITQKVSRLRARRPLPDRDKPPPAAVAAVPVRSTQASRTSGGSRARSTDERLRGRLRQEGEAMGPRELRRLLAQLRQVIDEGISEVEGGRRAEALAGWYARADSAQRQDFWLLMSEHFLADPQRARKAQAEYEAAVGTADEAAAEVRFRRATVSPRRRLLQRFSAMDGGIGFLVDLRAQMQPALRTDRRLAALDVEMEYMFSTWFDVGFLELRRISWDSPASLIEKLIRYEAVHDVRGWTDMKNRLDSDRRCYGFFHPRLPGEPLIFVEVALLDDMAAGITPLLDESAAASDLARATTAIFYSISNAQLGLRGVSFGDSLIKRVVQELKNEFPRLKVFATLSPIPGLRAWLQRHAADQVKSWPEVSRRELAQELALEPACADADIASAWLARLQGAQELPETSAARRLLKRAAAHYLCNARSDERPADPVARFHLGNGARVERLNWAADPSAKGLQQSFGLMVNYLYDLRRLDRHRASLARGKVAVSAPIQALLE